MISTLTEEPHEGGAYRVFARRTISRNKKAFFIVPYRGGHRGRDRKDDLSTMNFSVRKEGLRILSNITGGREGVNLKRLLAAMKSQGGDGQAAYPPGVVGMERGREKGTGDRDSS
jgi:hypothetical protein